MARMYPNHLDEHTQSQADQTFEQFEAMNLPFKSTLAPRIRKGRYYSLVTPDVCDQAA